MQKYGPTGKDLEKLSYRVLSFLQDTHRYQF